MLKATKQNEGQAAVESSPGSEHAQRNSVQLLTTSPVDEWNGV